MRSKQQLCFPLDCKGSRCCDLSSVVSCFFAVEIFDYPLQHGNFVCCVLPARHFWESATTIVLSTCLGFKSGQTNFAAGQISNVFYGIAVSSIKIKIFAMSATIVWRSSLALCSARVVSRDVVVLTNFANCLETVKDVVVNPEVETPSTHMYLLVQTRAFLRLQPWQRRSSAKVHGPGLCAMRKVLGYVWLKSLPPLKYESVQTAFAPKTHADAGLFLLLQAAELSREWPREIVVVQLDGKKAFDHVSHRAAFTALKLQGVCEFVFDGFDCGDLEWKLHEGALENGVVEQNSDELGTSSRSAGISSHLHNDHGIGAARLDEELDYTENDLETGRFCA